MDDVRAQLGAAVAGLLSAQPDPTLWSGPAAQAFSQAIDELSREVGGLIFDALVFLEPITPPVV